MYWGGRVIGLGLSRKFYHFFYAFPYGGVLSPKPKSDIRSVGGVTGFGLGPKKCHL